MKTTLEFKFKIGQIVYLKTDRDLNPRIVAGYSIRPNNLISYNLSNSQGEESFYDFEIIMEEEAELKRIISSN